MTGPWFVRPTDDRIVEEGKGQRIAYCPTVNSRLIAAAPELLAALESLLIAHASDLDPQLKDGTYEYAVNQARAAIAKARGAEGS